MATIVTALAEFTIDTAGTAEQIITIQTEASALVVAADRLNTGKIYVGRSDVDSNNFIMELRPGETFELDAPTIAGNTEAVSTDYI